MASDSVLHGELGLLSLFDLGQLLMLNGASGVLTVVSEGRRGYFYFEGGTIVNAIDDEYHEGEGAAYHLFTWRTGQFEFMPGAPSGARSITDNTEGLMMEAARRMDEAGVHARAEGEARRLVAHASSFEALRDAFQSVASETASLGEMDASRARSPFELLREPADALLFRPGAVPRLRSGGRWRAMGGEPLDAPAFESLRGRLLDGAPPPGSPGAARTHVLALENGRRCVVTHVEGGHEALWVRAAGLSPPGAARLDGDMAALDASLARAAGLLLVAGPDAASAEALFHACVARVADALGGTVLLVAEPHRWAQHDRAGAVVHATGDTVAGLARATQPDVAAFDLAHATHAAACLGTAPRVMAAAIAADAPGALARWCTLAGRRWGDGIEVVLGSGPVDVVLASRPAAADGRLAFMPVCLAPGPGGAGRPAGSGKPAASAKSAPAAPAAAAPTDEAMAALAAELSRTLRKAA